VENILTINGISKNYGRTKALDNLNLDIPKGSIFGILGPNGSGKTTTLGVILGITLPSSGEYFWFNQPPNHKILANRCNC